MGTRRRAAIAEQNPVGLSAPTRGPESTVWKRVMREDALRKQGRCCAYCREPMSIHEATADHVRPVIKGGLTEPKNIKAACYDCNQAKGSMTEVRFQKLIRNPPPDVSIKILLAHARFRIRAREIMAHKRILALVGLKPEQGREA